jgi:hypothetical protein
MHLNWISFTTPLVTIGILVGLISPALNAGTHFAQPKNVTYNPPNQVAAPLALLLKFPLLRLLPLLTGGKRSLLILLSGSTYPTLRVQ